MLVGLQARNSPTGTPMIDKAIRAVQLYGGNALEAPIYHQEERGRAILIEDCESEFFLVGAGVGLDFTRRPDPQDVNPYAVLLSRQSTQVNFLSVEEGHFEGDEWVVDFARNGDESNYQLFVHGGQAVRIRLNPAMVMPVI